MLIKTSKSDKALAMKTILRTLRRNNTPLLKCLKYVFHTYSLVALIGFMMCPAIHDFGNGSIDNSVLKGRTFIQEILHKGSKNTPLSHFVSRSASWSASFVNPTQNISLYSQQSVKNSITLISTTHLIL